MIGGDGDEKEKGERGRRARADRQTGRLADRPDRTMSGVQLGARESGRERERKGETVRQTELGYAGLGYAGLGYAGLGLSSESVSVSVRAKRSVLVMRRRLAAGRQAGRRAEQYPVLYLQYVSLAHCCSALALPVRPKPTPNERPLCVSCAFPPRFPFWFLFCLKSGPGPPDQRETGNSALPRATPHPV